MGPQGQQQVQVNVDKGDTKGVYSNLIQIQHSQEEFCLDFFNIFPPIGALTVRVVISLGHLKRMISALQDNLKKYEGKFGNVTEAKEPEKPTMGFGV